jgi:peptidoglycan/xylan/chitin deacetylase (PgdA/CDA1 family)
MSSGEYATSWKQSVELPSGFKQSIYSLARSQLLSLLSAVPKKRPEKFLRGLYCHYVFDDQRKEFERLITQLMTQGQFINTDTCLEMLQGKREIDGRYFHLSFDDGFRNIYTNAFPILKKYSIPAVHFVPSQLMDADWSQAAHYCLETTRYRAVIEMCKWNDLREMAAAGIEIGSHSRTHARLASISHNLGALKNEIAGSKQDIEAHLGRECRFFAWPYGTPDDVDATTLKIVERAGYKACFGAYRGSIAPGKTSIMSVPRHLFEPQWPLSHIEFFAGGRADSLIKR